MEGYLHQMKCEVEGRICYGFFSPFMVRRGSVVNRKTDLTHTGIDLPRFVEK